MCYNRRLRELIVQWFKNITQTTYRKQIKETVPAFKYKKNWHAVELAVNMEHSQLNSQLQLLQEFVLVLSGYSRSNDVREL